MPLPPTQVFRPGVLLLLALAPHALGGPDSAAGRLEQLGKHWWDDQQAGASAYTPIPAPDRPLTLLDAERADPTTWLGLNLILRLAPADRWRVANGQTFVQRSPSDDEQELLNALGSRVGLKRPRSYEVRTEAGTIVWVGLSSPAGSVNVPVAWPEEWRTVEAARAMRAVGWRSPALAGSGLVDPSFEDHLATRVAWWSQGIVVPDPARAARGARSMRLEGDAEILQRVAVEPGVTITVRVKLAAQGGGITPTLSWEDDYGKIVGEVRGDSITDSSWQDASLSGTAPTGASAVALVLQSRGDGFANADDVRFTRSDQVAAGEARLLVRSWDGTAIRLYADPAQVPDAEQHLRHIDQAVRGALGLLGQPTASVVDVQFGPTAPRAERGKCSAATDPDATACVLLLDLEALWGAPGNTVFPAAFAAALSGATLPPAQGELEAGARWTEGKPPPAWVSFSRWLLDQYGTAAVRAAWQSTDLGTFQAGRRSFAELESAWRQ